MPTKSKLKDGVNMIHNPSVILWHIDEVKEL